MRICQLQNILSYIFILSFFGGCSTENTKMVVQPIRKDQIITADWFKIPFKFTHRDFDDNYVTHPFFDVEPGYLKDRRLVNYFTTIPEQSSFKYNFDLYSGKLYKDRDYCAVEDVWNFYSGDVTKPNFTQGIVPRTYNQNHEPQKIIIFSDPKLLDPFRLSPTNYENARIVGSVVIEACESYPCDSKTKWTPAQILVGVNPADPNYSSIEQIGELKKNVDWAYVKSILSNQDGVHRVGNRSFPAYRVSKELNLEDSINYFEKNSTFQNMAELKTFREECFKLYDEVWDQNQKIRTESNEQQLKFLSFFRDFYKTNSNKFYQCQLLVRPANINENDKRLWFFAYLQAFTNLEKNGFYFSCNDKSWFYNPKSDGEHFLNDQNLELDKCRARELEKSFDQAINGLSLMRNQINKGYRFIEYDTQRGGSHQKIYGWVVEGNKSSVCKYEKSKENQFDVFPQDVTWPSLKTDDRTQIK